jgi:hypothetical protein
MLYNNRYWFSKEKSKTEYDFGSVAYGILDMATDGTKIALGQRNGARIFNSSTGIVTNLSTLYCKDVDYYDVGNQLIFNLWDNPVAEYKCAYFNGTSLVYYLKATDVNYEYCKCVSGLSYTYKGWFTEYIYPNFNLWQPNNPYQINIPSLNGYTMGICPIDANECFVIAEAGYYGSVYFRKASAPSTNLAYPSTSLRIDRMRKSIDNTKIYGIAGNFYEQGHNSWIGGVLLYIYDIASNSWSTVPLPANCKGYMPVYYNSKLYVTGFNSVTSKACIIPFNGSAFESEIYLPADDNLYCGVQVGDRLYLGGYNGKIYSYTE